MTDTFIQVADALPQEFRGVALDASFVPDFFERYLERYIEEPMSGCWLWTGSQTTAGYGNFTFQKKTFYAHRTSYEAENGEGSSVGKVVRHRCDNPCCINPEHLLVGTQKDNMADARSRNRMNPVKGECHPRAVLTDESVVSIRARAKAGEAVIDIAADYSAAWSTIEGAITGKNWTHIDGALPHHLVSKKKPIPPRRVGSAASGAILTETQVYRIKQRLRTGEKGRALAAEYGVSPVTISAINVGRIWKHVS